MFHKLSPRDHELLTMLSGEAAEIIHIKEKIFQHGMDSSHADYKNWPNRNLLEKEIGDFLGILDEIIDKKIIDPDAIQVWCRRKWSKALQYTHHQGDEE